jgi:membrane protein DedA with SNARE-associated domain
MILTLMGIALATLLSEDLACVAAGALVAQGQLQLVPATAACIVGIFTGDLLLYAGGRLLGEQLQVSRHLPAQRVATAKAWLEQRGLLVVLLSRFTPGLRLPTYFAAGLLRTSLWRFALALLLAALIWTPILVTASMRSGEHSLAWLPAIVLGLYALRQLLHYERRRRLIGAIRRKLQWEFWPAWAVYLPLLPYFAYLAIRHRSLTLFAAANPGIPSGGLVGESKSAILRRLSHTPPFTIVNQPDDALRFMQDRKLDYPIVLKPDIGERGEGVVIIRDEAELRLQLTRPMMLQEYVAGLEFGVFYYRMPDEPAGRILSITRKHFPTVVGDGIRSLKDLILADDRAVIMAGTYARSSRTPMDTVPMKGECVQLVEIGSHSRGAIFLNAASLLTDRLEQTIDAIARLHAGFCIGRFDIRAASVEAFQAGELSVIELNGVAGEATHIYDPSVSLIDAYRSLARQWRLAFEIGALNRRNGARVMTLSQLAEQLKLRYSQESA